MTVAVVASASAVIPALPAQAEPRTPRLGPVIDGYAPYQGQTTCDPDPKPGVLAFRRIVLRAYPDTGSGQLGRACNVGGQSEHKDGRAWDWLVSVSDPADKRAAEDLLDWLLATDRFGHRDAIARRIGLMYVIWNRRWWNSWTREWHPYGGSSPHTDHVHFSFSWDGAYQRVTFWNRLRSTVNGIDLLASGAAYRLAAGNGRVVTRGEGPGSVSLKGWHPHPVVEIVQQPSGDGYWLVRRNGSVVALNGAPAVRAALSDRVVDAEAAATGGLWVVTANGRVRAYGGADHLGDLVDRDDLTVASLAATPIGDGYLLTTRGGRVFAFGDAAPAGDLVGEDVVVGDLEMHPSGRGYWIVSPAGKVYAFGAARRLGEVLGHPDAPIVEMQSSVSGRGYWLLDEFGRVRSYGDAPPLGSF